ncbi:hypothetical protein QTO01_15120 [Vibrio mytili]|uniref:hypothetical protein n=1 Tax=Vibrio mytili TaxID=50718 RepID=UPI002F4079F1
MMHVDLVDMDDLITDLDQIGIECTGHDVDSVKNSIDKWLESVDSIQRDRFSKLIFSMEQKGILLPDIENVVRWGAQRLPQ